MKVGLVIDDSLDRHDGVQQYVITVGKWLRLQGHEVHYLSSRSRRTDLANLHSLAPNLRLRFNQNRVGTPLPAPKKQLAQLLAKEKFDVLHFQLPHSPLLSGRIIKLAPPQTALVGTFHILPYSAYQTFAARQLAKIIKPDWPHFHSLISVSSPARDFAANCFGVQSKVVPNAVDVKSLRSKSSKVAKASNLNLVFLGRLVARKGAVELVRALGHLNKNNFKNWQLQIAGQGPLKPKLTRLVQKLGLSRQIKFCGFIPENEKADFLASADIAVFPALGGESFGIVLIEAMAAGSGVVVGGNNLGYRSVLGDWPDCLVNPSQTIEFADKLKRLMIDSRLRERLHSVQVAAVKNYDIATVGPKLLKIYDQAIAKIAQTEHNNS